LPTPAPSRLDATQVLPGAYDDAQAALRVTGTLTAELPEATEVVIDHANDSIKLGDGTNLVTTSSVGPDVGLDVNVIGGTITGTFTSTGFSDGIRSMSVVVGDTPTKVPPAPLSGRDTIAVRVWGAQKVFFGGSGVTVANGYPKFQYEEIIADSTNALDLWAICETGQSSEVRLIELA
jgi:hypothetical protein